MHNCAERDHYASVVREPDILSGTGKDVLRKLDHAIDLARIVRNDSIRSGRQMTIVGGHLNNLESLLREMKRDIEKDEI